MREIAIEGLDGAGKTTVAARLAQHYENLGQTAMVFAPYRAASAAYGEIYDLWKSNNGARMAMELVHRALAAGRQEAAEAGADLLIFDRHWMTAFTEIARRPELVAEWGEDLPQTAYLRVSPETARQRAENDTGAPWMSRHNHDHYALRYEQLCRDYGPQLLGIYRNDNDVALDAIVRNIAWDLNVRR